MTEIITSLRKRFESKAVKENSLKEPKVIPSSTYKKCFKKWIKRRHMYVAKSGNYFEGDKINLSD